MRKPAKILVAPMDWGLGHASRCVPIVEAMLAQGAEVILGSNGRALSYLQQVFPSLTTVLLPAYDVRYPSHNMLWNMVIQSNKLWRVLKQEHQLLDTLIKKYALTGVVSDNRFGCWSAQVPCVFISHQTYPSFPTMLAWPGNKVNHHFIRKYNKLWIPDMAGNDSLSGKLSRPIQGMPVDYLGCLSQLKSNIEKIPFQYELLVLLSGPEPQRSLLENKIIEQLEPLKLKAIIVQGKTEAFVEKQYSSQLRVVSYLKQEELARAIASARYVLCRSGYSSLMDLSVMGKKAILIPTPGQAEQLYLAKRMQNLKYSPFQYQHKMDIQKGLKLMHQYAGLPMHLQQPKSLEKAVQAFLVEATSITN